MGNHNFCRRCFGEKGIVLRVAARKGPAGSSQELPRRGELHWVSPPLSPLQGSFFSHIFLLHLEHRMSHVQGPSQFEANQDNWSTYCQHILELGPHVFFEKELENLVTALNT